MTLHRCNIDGAETLTMMYADGATLTVLHIGAVFNSKANFSAVQYDGFEKLQLIAAVDFGHSSATVDSGMFRGPPNPDWYHFQGWPVKPARSKSLRGNLPHFNCARAHCAAVKALLVVYTLHEAYLTAVVVLLRM